MNGEVSLYKRASEKSVKFRFRQNYERTANGRSYKMLSRKVWKIGSNKVMRERRSPFIQTCFREKCEFRFKQNYERTAKYVHTNLLLRNVWKLGSNKVMSEQ